MGGRASGKISLVRSLYIIKLSTGWLCRKTERKSE